MSPAEQLTLTLLSSRSGAAPWSHDSWVLGVPQWAEDHQVAGALAHRRQAWPPTLVRWPEERVRTMTFALRMDDQLLLPDAVALFETAETLASWLTGRTWAKGVRMAEVMETAQLSLAESPRYTSQLWRQLRKDQRTWLTKNLIRVIDGEYPRDLWKWFNVLDFMRATHAPRT